MSFAHLRAARVARHAHASSSYVATTEPPIVAPSSLSEAKPSAAPELVDRAGLYGALPAALQIRRTERAGRGIWARDSVRRGTDVLAVPPHAAVLSTRYLSAFCSICCAPATPATELKRCTRCRTIYYCSTTCQTGDWALHKRECASLQAWAKAAPEAALAVPPESVRCLARVLWLRRDHGEDSAWTREIDAMQSHKSSLPASGADAQAHFAHALVRYLGLSAPSDLAPFGIHSPGDLVDLLSRFSTNSITLSTPDLTPIGVAVSPAVALFNHSCAPNAVVVFPDLGATRSSVPTARVVAISDIAAGEEITTAYIDTTVSRDMRRAELRATYSFECACTLCVLPPGAPLDPRAALWCPKSCGGQCAVPSEDDSPSACQQCGTPVPSPSTIVNAIELGTEALAKAQSLQNTDPAHARRLVSKLLPLVRAAGLTPGAHPLLALVRLQQEFLLDDLGSAAAAGVDWDMNAAVRNAAAVCAGLDVVLAPGHPVRALARAELGKLLAADEPATASPGPTEDSESGATWPPTGVERVALAARILAHAHEELCIGFGSASGGGVVGREVRALAQRLESEMGALKRGVRNVREFG